MKNADPAIVDALSAGDYKTALKIAVSLGTGQKFKDKPYLDAIGKAYQAICTPEFYKAIGKDPEELIVAGVAALRARFNTEKV